MACEDHSALSSSLTKNIMWLGLLCESFQVEEKILNAKNREKCLFFFFFNDLCHLYLARTWYKCFRDGYVRRKPINSVTITYPIFITILIGKYHPRFFNCALFWVHYSVKLTSNHDSHIISKKSLKVICNYHGGRY